MNFISSHRLKPFIKEILPYFLEKGYLRISNETKDKLLKISKATKRKIVKRRKNKVEKKEKDVPPNQEHF